jgi:dihydroorotase-like cyclic amidohydrolase
MARYDTAVLNGTVVVPYVGALRCDVGIRAGRIASLADAIEPADADAVVDARGRLVLPGAVDSHFHIGIYRDLATDARSETASALAGGVTTVISYFRTGLNYLNKSGPYRTIFPEVVAATAGRAHTDFGYHIGVMTTEQLAEVDWLVGEQGVGSFKYYMFYKGLNLTSDSTRGSAYTMAETYDLGHLYLLMRQVAAAGSARPLETTLHHLALTHATAGGIVGKVNPPIRTQADREALWQAVEDGRIDTVVSDHACCAEEDKGEDLWKALPGFGGTALLYPYLVSEGHLRRGLPLTRIVELASANPARAFGLYPRKGTIAVGADADLVVLDPAREHVVSPAVLHSAQDFTPFAGMRVRGWPTHTLLRGRTVFRDGTVVGEPQGHYVKRPIGLYGTES